MIQKNGNGVDQLKLRVMLPNSRLHTVFDYNDQGQIEHVLCVDTCGLHKFHDQDE